MYTVRAKLIMFSHKSNLSLVEIFCSANYGVIVHPYRHYRNTMFVLC